MQKIEWTTFALSQTLSRTLVHFFPSSGAVTAPYPVMCHLSCFHESGYSRSITLDGLRLGHPDGVRLEDLFPDLREQPGGLFGVTIEFSVTQPRVSLETSRCYVEFVTQTGSVRFALPSKKKGREEREPALMIRDPYHRPSVVFVNPSAEPCSIPSGLCELFSEGSAQAELPGMSIREFPVAKEKQAQFASHECSWGICKCSPIESISDKYGALCGYVVHRDTVSHLPVSVAAL